MKLLRPRITPAENIALLGASIAILVAMALLMSFVPSFSPFIVLLLPLISALATYYCQDKYVLPYAIAAVIVVMASTAFNLTGTFFFVIPTIFVGSLFGFFLRKGISSVWLILAISLLELGLNYLMLLVVKMIYGIDMVELTLTLIGLKEKNGIREIVPAFIFCYALIETTIAFFVIILNVNQFNRDKDQSFLSTVVSFGLASFFFMLALLLRKIALPYSYLLAMLTIYLSLVGSPNLFKKNPWGVYLILAILMASSFYLSAFLFAFLPRKEGPLLFLMFFASLSFTNFVSALLFKMQGRRTHEESH